jgi:hypothetical protein
MLEILIPVIVIGGWLVFSIYYVHKAKQDYRSINPYILESIPSVFPTLGILCTFVGITIGLSGFDTKNIESSIPNLLNGLTMAFYASMAGIVGLFIFQKLIAIRLKEVEDDPNKPKKLSGEVEALQLLTEKFDKLSDVLTTNTEKIEFAISEKLTNFFNWKLEELQKQQDKAREHTANQLIMIANNLVSLQKGVSDLNTLTEKNAASANASTEKIITAMGANNELVRLKFDEFSELLRKNNTEALVQVMKQATEEFNAQMSSCKAAQPVADRKQRTYCQADRTVYQSIRGYPDFSHSDDPGFAVYGRVGEAGRQAGSVGTAVKQGNGR